MSQLHMVHMERDAVPENARGMSSAISSFESYV